MKKLSNKGFSILEAILILLIVGIIGGVGYFVYSTNQKNDTASSVEDNVVSKPSPDSKSDNSSQKTTSYESVAESVKVTLTHPSSWQVKEYAHDYNPKIKNMYIKSPKGNYMHLFQPDGVGGDCEPDSYAYTLVKKIMTATPDVVFTEYTTADKDFPTTRLRVEDLSRASAGHKNLKEGENGSGVCQNVSGYSSVGNRDGTASVFISFNDKPKFTLGSTFTAAELSGDLDLIKMLESMKVEVKN